MVCGVSEFLPSIEYSDHQVSLPLSGSSAAAILRALLADTSDTAAHVLAEQMRVDPLLAWWALCRVGDCWHDSSSDYNDCEHLAQWLAEYRFSQFAWEADAKEPAGDSDQVVWLSSNSRRWSKLVHLAVRVAATDSQPDAKTYLEIVRQHGPTLLDVLVDTSRETAIDDQMKPPEVAADDRHQRLAEETVATVWESNSAPLFLSQIAKKVSRLHDLQTAYDDQLRHEKTEAMRELAYGASHEVNNPLANISSRAQTLLYGETDPERRRKLATINSQAFRAHEMIANMMLFAKPPQPQLTDVDIVQVVAEVVERSQEEAQRQETLLKMETTGPLHGLTASADADQVAVAVQTLVRNALEALQSGGEVVVSIRSLTDVSEAGVALEAVAIEVLDNGPGISREALPHLFDPFYSGREAGRGLGFGLSKCWTIAKQHGGSITVESPRTGGATFTLILPRSANAATPSTTVRIPPDSKRRA